MPLSQHQRTALQAVLLAALVFLAYWPALYGEFLIDDDKLITDSSLVRASNGLVRIWATTEPTDYWPLTNSSFWLEWRLWGNNSTGYHVTNLLLHIAAALLIWAILRKLQLPGAYLAALLFAVHPVNVESVAWIAERKNTLSMVFFLLAILWYLPTIKPRTTDHGPRTSLWYWLSFAAFVLAMLSKGSVAILPAVLLLLIWWQRRSIRVADLLRTAPFFLVAIALAGVNVWFQKHGLDVTVRDINFWQRLAGAGAVAWFYLAKALAPIHLVFIYPQWSIEGGSWLWWLPLAAAIIVTAILARHLIFPKTLWRRGLLFAWLFFCVSLVPVLGFTDVGFMQWSPVADHYQYIAIIAVAALAAAAWRYWHNQSTGPLRIAASAAAIFAVATLALATWQQTQQYTTALTLYETILLDNPSAWIVHNNLGLKLQTMGDLTAARAEYETALRIHPNYPDALNNLGVMLHNQGHLQEAIDLYQRALQLRPDYFYARNSLGNAFSDLGRLDEAIQQYELALRLKPDYAIVYYNLGNALRRLGNLQGAIDHFRQAIELDPTFTQAFMNLSDAYAQAHRPDDAIAAAQSAVALARSAGNTLLAEKIEAWIAAYRASLAAPR